MVEKQILVGLSKELLNYKIENLNPNKISYWN